MLSREDSFFYQLWMEEAGVSVKHVDSKDVYIEPEADMGNKSGFRRPIIGMAATVLAQFSEMFQEAAGVPVIKKAGRSRRQTRKNRHAGNWKKPHQGAQECARRVRQMQAGTLTPNYVR